MKKDELKEYMNDLEDLYNPTITDVEFEQMLFNRLISDAVYFFGFGNFNENSIYFKNIDKLMNEINLKAEVYSKEMELIEILNDLHCKYKNGSRISVEILKNREA